MAPPWRIQLATHGALLNALIYHVASGQAFLSGVALIVLAVVSPTRPGRRWVSVGRTTAACLGFTLVAVSATPLPGWFYLAAGAISLAWLLAEGLSRAISPRPGRWIRPAVLAVWLLGAALELPFHRTPALPRLGDPPVDVVGDSISAGMGGEAETWPRILARSQHVVVHDLSLAGATAASALKDQAGRACGSGSLVLVEIGGNDVLAETPPEAFERALDALLARLAGGGRTVVMLEVPLPPLANRYGAAQRRAARRHGVALVPKRVLLGVLTSGRATLDTVHLSPSGHTLMAERMWAVIRGAFGPREGPVAPIPDPPTGRHSGEPGRRTHEAMDEGKGRPTGVGSGLGALPRPGPRGRITRSPAATS